MKIQLLGTRGSCATSNKDARIFGGDTSCVKVQQGEDIIYIDAGTGLMSECDKPLNHAVILLSHYHLDHICALALFAAKCKKLTVYAPEYNGKSCGEVLQALYSPPFWPVGLNAVCDISFITIMPKQGFTVKGFNISCATLCHPDGATGYCIKRDGKSICYLCDHEQDSCTNSNEIEALAKNADLLIADAPYDAEAYAKCKGYGHSSTGAIADLVQKANIKKALLTHFNPYALDKDILFAEEHLTTQYPKLSYARQGGVIEL